MIAQPGIARTIALRPVTHVMRNPIDFNRQIGAGAEEIEDERPRRMLIAEPQAIGRAAQLPPQQYFGQRHFAPQLFCSVYGPGRFVWTLQFTPPSALRAATSPSQVDGEN